MLCSEVPRDALTALLTRYRLQLDWVDEDAAIPGSHFGEPEAGLIGNIIYARSDTPLHSLLHESCHYICMDHARRTCLHTDAGGDYDEENGVCYLSILLASDIPGFNREKMMADMDSWGYTFRLGSARKWFTEDASDALQWLQRHQLVDKNGHPTGYLRGTQ